MLRSPGQLLKALEITCFCNICGMALGGWLAGYIYDQLGSYAPAFALGMLFNIGNIAIIGWLAAGALGRPPDAASNSHVPAMARG